MSYANTDAIMCFLWILTYTLVLIGTEKYQYPLISPITQIIIAPFEFSVLFKLIFNGNIDIDYIFISYLYWTIVEIVIVVVLIRHRFIPKRYTASYLVAMAVITIILYYLVAYKDQQFFFSYTNTLLGEIIWFFHVLKKDYPMEPMVFLIFLAKFVGDAISIPVYWGNGPWVISLICILLPILDFMFIHVYFQRRVNHNSLKGGNMQQ